MKLKIFKRLIVAITTYLMMITGCYANEPAEDYFSGPQLAKAIEKGDIERVKMLATLADLNSPGNEDMTLLFYAMQAASREKDNRLAIVTQLVKHGADPLQQVPDMGSVAEVVAKSDSPAWMKALIEGGMSPNAIVEDTPVIFDTTTEHSFKVLKYLVSQGADINKKDSLGQTVLTEALASMQLVLVEWLLNHGADPTIVTVNGWQFGNMLQNTINNEGKSDAKTGAKLEDIRKLAINKGMQWPPKSY